MVNILSGLVVVNHNLMIKRLMDQVLDMLVHLPYETVHRMAGQPIGFATKSDVPIPGCICRQVQERIHTRNKKFMNYLF